MQMEFEKVRGWGGKRRGAGRPNKSGLVSHAKRRKVDYKKPLHVTLRLKKNMPNLRTDEVHDLFKAAREGVRKFGVSVVHYALQGNHIHLIVEARDNRSLSKGMKSLTCRLGKYLRRVIGGRGGVWAGRFHLHILKTPTEVRRALEYVLMNRAKHAKVFEHLDEFSSCFEFKEWRLLLGRRINGYLQEQLRYVSESALKPRSWLLQSGWKRAPS